MQRYTTSARHDLVFSRYDRKKKGQDGETRSYRQKMVMKKMMKVANIANMLKAGSDKTLEVMDQLLEMLSRVEPDIGGDENHAASDGDDNQVTY